MYVNIFPDLPHKPVTWSNILIEFVEYMMVMLSFVFLPVLILWLYRLIS